MLSVLAPRPLIDYLGLAVAAGPFTKLLLREDVLAVDGPLIKLLFNDEVLAVAVPFFKPPVVPRPLIDYLLIPVVEVLSVVAPPSVEILPLNGVVPVVEILPLLKGYLAPGLVGFKAAPIFSFIWSASLALISFIPGPTAVLVEMLFLPAEVVESGAFGSRLLTLSFNS